MRRSTRTRGRPTTTFRLKPHELAGVRHLVTLDPAQVCKMLDASCQPGDSLTGAARTAHLVEQLQRLMGLNNLSASEFLARFFTDDILQEHLRSGGKSDRGTTPVLSSRITSMWASKKYQEQTAKADRGSNEAEAMEVDTAHADKETQPKKRAAAAPVSGTKRAKSAGGVAEVVGRDLTSAEWLLTHLQDEDVVVLDATWGLDASSLENPGKAKYTQGHLPGSLFVDIDAIAASVQSPYPHMLPTQAAFEAEMDRLGVRNTDHVVCTDSSGFYMGSARLWWTFKAFGHARVSVLDGGTQTWCRAGGSLQGPKDSDEQEAKKGGKGYRCTPQLSEWVVDRAEVLQLVTAGKVGAKDEEGGVVVGDVRSVGRWTAQGEDEPWRSRFPSVRRGRIPRSRNLPFQHLFLGKDGKMLSTAALSRVLDQALNTSFSDGKLERAKQGRVVVATCGSGVTAAVLCLALSLCGGHARLYDGSWCEWGTTGGPVARGEFKADEEGDEAKEDPPVKPTVTPEASVAGKAVEGVQASSVEHKGA